MVKLTKGQTIVLIATSAPMAVIGAAGAVATYVNMNEILHRSASALGLVAAGEGATLVCALVALAVTLMGQHTPTFVRLGLWLIPLLASATGVALARNTVERVTMAVTPLAMTAAGEGIAFVARRVVAYRTGTDIEQQRRSGLLLWHANRAANGSGLGKRLSTSAVWRLTKQFAATDGQLSVQLGQIQRFRIGEGADKNLSAVLGGSQRPAVAPADASPALPPASASQAVSEADESLDAVAETVALALPAGDDDGYDFIKQVMEEGAANIVADPLVKLLTVAEVAEARGVQPGTVRSWVARGSLRVHRKDADGRNLFHPLDVFGDE